MSTPSSSCDGRKKRRLKRAGPRAPLSPRITICIRHDLLSCVPRAEVPRGGHGQNELKTERHWLDSDTSRDKRGGGSAAAAGSPGRITAMEVTGRNAPRKKGGMRRTLFPPSTVGKGGIKRGIVRGEGGGGARTNVRLAPPFPTPTRQPSLSRAL